MLEVNLKKLKPYGDRLNDGTIQLSFTLPVKESPKAKEAAKKIAQSMNLERVSVVHMESMGSNFTFFVVYGYLKNSLNFTKIRVATLNVPVLNFEELKQLMDKHLKEPLVIVGGCTGSDAHTVGIDAILNMKGFAGDYGLERYPKFKVHNLRAQVSNRELIDKAAELKANAILVSQVVTQRDAHIKNLKELKKLIASDKRFPKNIITIVGGPRIDHAMAVKLGFSAGFGPGTKPSQVASFIVNKYLMKGGNMPGDEKTKKKWLQDKDFNPDIDEATMEDSFTPLVYQRPKSGHIRPPEERKVPPKGKGARTKEKRGKTD